MALREGDCQRAVSQLVVLLVLALVCNLQGLHASDPDPVSDFAPGVISFVLRDIFTNGEVTMDSGGIRAAVTPENFPAIRNEGITYVRFRVVPCGALLPHYHPRATEILTLISGGPIQVGFVDTNGTTHINIMYPGDVTVFPRGLLHYQLNIGEDEAEYISALNSENPGTLTAAAALFRLPQRALATAFNQRARRLRSINSTLSGYIRPTLKKVDRSGCIPGKDITVDF